ncbi:DUF3846 domain-containing protein [Candidatus Avoscillospira sp. LCP25S3_F1]|uniref:DUF3846 domain-containing protein n=1 Tax=Candidatus Avoscillospira sp. LCP25S3_F1 TaxID=3438825 RepID=UPI003F9027DE
MEQACRTLEISRSGYYDWLHHKPCIREQRNQALKRKLVELHQKYPALGLDSLYHLLKPDFGCSRKRVHRQMRLAGICSVRHRAYKVTTNSQHSHPVASNLLKRNFFFERPNQAWVGDITYIPTGEGWPYDVYPDIHDHDDLGRYYIEKLDAMQVPEHLRNYIDYEAYGRDIALEESGQFTDLGYVRNTGDSFHEYYDGERGSIPEEYRVMTFQDDIPEEEISEWAMDLAYDMDEFFRQNDPQYAAEHPEEHAAKEEIYENLSDCRIASLEEKLKALGQTPEDYLPSELEKFKEAVGYEAYLDVDPQVIREAIENPDQSHVDEMLAFAEQANREYEAELYGQPAAPTPDDRETGETVRTPRGTFHVTDMSREQMEAAGYGFHHESEDGKYLIMANGSRAFAIPSGDAPEHTAPEKMTVLVVEPMKEPYVKEIAPGLHALQAEVGGDIAASYPFDDPVGLVLNDEGKLIGLDLNRSLRDDHGEIYDIVAGTFLVVGLGPESFASLPPDMIQKYTEQFKRPELFASINGQIVSVPVEPENPLRTAEMTLEDDYGMIDGIINNGRRGEEPEKAQGEARRTTPEKKPSIRERLEDAKRECGSRKGPDKPTQQKKPPELGDL